MKTEIFKCYYEFLNRTDKNVNGVDQAFADAHPNYQEDNETNRGCWCCESCESCVYKNDSKDNSPTEALSPNGFIVPVIENIHQKVYEAVMSTPGALDMSDWHTCDTTHCRAGWVEHLAGPAFGKRTSHSFAAMEIYHASSPNIPVPPTQFYKTNDEALADMKRCAELEIEQNKNKV